MDEIIARIKEKAIAFNASLVDDEFLDLIVEKVVNRALIFTNRDQLVARYEEALAELEEDEELDNRIDVPIPQVLEIVLAEAVVNAYRTAQTKNDASNGRVTRVVDGQQQVDFSSTPMSFFDSSNDSEIFSGNETLLRRYLLPKVREHRVRRF